MARERACAKIVNLAILSFARTEAGIKANTCFSSHESEKLSSELLHLPTCCGNCALEITRMLLGRDGRRQIASSYLDRKVFVFL